MLIHHTIFTFRRKTVTLANLLLPSIDQLPAWLPGQTRLRNWLQNRAFRTALHQAQQQFARQYPEWTASLFDEYFLKHNAAPLLVHYLQHAAPSTPLELATTWDEHLGPASATVRQRRIAELTPAAADFLRSLEANLQRNFR
jgi:hypothetical protein